MVLEKHFFYFGHSSSSKIVRDFLSENVGAHNLHCGSQTSSLEKISSFMCDVLGKDNPNPGSVICSINNPFYGEIKEKGYLLVSLEDIIFYCKENKKNSRKVFNLLDARFYLNQSEEILKKRNTVVIIGQGDLIDKKTQFMTATGRGGKGLSFEFVSVVNQQYCDAVREFRDLVSRRIVHSFYVISDHNSSPDFTRKTKKSLNRCNAGFRAFLDEVQLPGFLVDLKVGKTEVFLGVDISDRKRMSCKKVI